MNKKISSPLAISIIIVFAVLVGVYMYGQFKVFVEEVAPSPVIFQVSVVK